MKSRVTITLLLSLLAPLIFAQEKPNILLIMADDMGYSDLGCYGSGIETPNLDKLAAEGLRFSQFYNTGRCCPSRASLMTGLYSHQAGVGHMMGKTEFPEYSDALKENALTIPEVLKEAGYETFMSGKWHLGWSDAGSPNERGFDRFYGSRGYVDSYYTIVKRTDIYLNDTIINPAGEPPVNHLYPDREFYTTDTYTDYAMHFIDEHLVFHADKPFFGYIAHNAPHFPLHAKPEDTEKYRGRFLEEGWEPLRQKRLDALKEADLIAADVELSPQDSPDWSSLSPEVQDELDFKFALYCAIIDRLDQNVGRLVDHLEERGVLANTLILFLSDNGSTKETGMFGIGGHDVKPSNYEEWGRKGGWTSSLGQGWANVANTPFRRYKRENHQGGISSPLIIWGGESIAAKPAPGTLTHQTAHIIDLLPSLAEIAGAPEIAERKGQPVQSFEGKSLLPVIQGGEIGPRTLYWEHEGNRAVLDGDWKLVGLGGQPWELYHLAKDRTELTNLIDQEPVEAAALERKWKTWAERVGVRPWPEVEASRKRVRQAEKN